MRWCLLLCLLALLPRTSEAATWHIQADGLGDAPTIQAGIDSAAVGDTVLVGPGTYNEQIEIPGKDIVIRGELGAAATTIDGTGLGTYGVIFWTGCTRSAVMEDFTITGHGTGVAIYQSEPTLQDCVITANGGEVIGAGIIMTGNGDPGPWAPLLRRNEITDNHSTGTSGGVGAQKKMIPEVLGNYIAENSAEVGDGGGLWIRTEFSGTIIRGNVIENNVAGDHGGGIYVGGLATIFIEISENVIVNNTAEGLPTTGESGGGIWLQDTDAWVHHNTLVRNTGNGPNDTYGGAIVVHEMGSPLIEQNVIALTTNGGGIFCHSGVTPTIRNNLGWQNSPVEGVGLCENWWQSDGNVIADPLFCDAPGGDYSMVSGSPALTHPSGPLGAIPAPGCTPILVEATTWGRIKVQFASR